VLTDSLPREYAWHSPEPSVHLLRIDDPEAEVIATHGGGDPALIYKRIGLGSVLVWTGTPNDVAWQVPDDLAIIRQIVANAARAASQWVRIPLDPFTIPPHGRRDLPVRFDAAAQNPGSLFANIRLESDDPEHPIVRIPVRLDVLPPRGAAKAMQRSAR